MQCGICDMAGNVKEWNTETDSFGDGCVCRGGRYTGNYTSYRDSYSSNTTGAYDIGFRIVLYL